jgi:glycosyltransferase involved in cell wall biosynthesis
MKSIVLDIILPVKDRTTVNDCVLTLLAAIEPTKNIELGRILICDGGSSHADCQQQLQQVAQLSRVEILDRPHPGFNKGWLLNQGIAAATAPVLLISDIDILWNATAIAAVANAAAQHPAQLYCIQSVQESMPMNVAIDRPRYTYRLTRSATTATVEVHTAPPPGLQRPGYGLLCGARSLFQAIGGYRHDFWGWGWEDQDLLMRSQLLGYSVCELGQVIHQSHKDIQRNAFAAWTPQQSRDRNIHICLAGIAQGQLIGDLAPGAKSRTTAPIHVLYPPELCD